MRKFLFLLLAATAFAQPSNPGIVSVSVAPSGSCTSGLPNQQVLSTGVQYSCQSGTWGAINGGGAGSGTVGAGTTGQVATYPGNGNSVSGATALPNGILATTQSPANNSQLIASTAYVDAAAAAARALAIPNMSSWFVSPNCGTQTNCTTIFGDTKYVVDATSNSTTTITSPTASFQCPGSVYPCSTPGTGSDAGKVAWATTQGTGAGIGYLIYTTFVCPQTTIASVTNSTTVVLSNACTANGTANVVFIWGHDDGATLAAVNFGCNSVHFATNSTFIMTGQPFFNTNNCDSTGLRSSVGAPGASMIGDGFNASQAVFVLTPNFNYAGCTTSSTCFGAAARSMANLQFWGTGLTSASNSNCSTGANKNIVQGYASSTVMFGVDVAGICPGESGMVGIAITSNDEVYSEAGAQEVGQYACLASTTGGIVHFQANDCHNTNVGGSAYGLVVQGTGTVLSYGNFPLINVLLQNSSILISSGSVFQSAGGAFTVETQGTSKFISYGDTVTGTVKIGANTSMQAANTSFSGVITNNGTINSLGGNVLGATPNSAGGGHWTGTNVLSGSCRGTATSSATLGLYGFGQNTTSACTSTTTTGGIPIATVLPTRGTVSQLTCNTTHVGVNASSGVVTVLKNGSPTSITCTIGTAAFCIDATHTDTPVLGDVYGVQFTTQGSEVLAGVSCVLMAW